MNKPAVAPVLPQKAAGKLDFQHDFSFPERLGDDSYCSDHVVAVLAAGVATGGEVVGDCPEDVEDVFPANVEALLDPVRRLEEVKGGDERREWCWEPAFDPHWRRCAWTHVTYAEECPGGRPGRHLPHSLAVWAMRVVRRVADRQAAELEALRAVPVDHEPRQRLFASVAQKPRRRRRGGVAHFAYHCEPALEGCKAYPALRAYQADLACLTPAGEERLSFLPRAALAAWLCELESREYAGATIRAQHDPRDLG